MLRAPELKRCRGVLVCTSTFCGGEGAPGCARRWHFPAETSKTLTGNRLPQGCGTDYQRQLHKRVKKGREQNTSPNRFTNGLNHRDCPWRDQTGYSESFGPLASLAYELHPIPACPTVLRPVGAPSSPTVLHPIGAPSSPTVLHPIGAPSSPTVLRPVGAPSSPILSHFAPSCRSSIPSHPVPLCSVL